MGLARLITSRRQSKVRRHSARAFEPVRIIDRGLEGERRNSTNARHAHELLADAIVADHRLHLIVEPQIGWIRYFPCVEYRHQSSVEHRFSSDLLPNHSVVRAMRYLAGEPDTEHPE